MAVKICVRHVWRCAFISINMYMCFCVGLKFKKKKITSTNKQTHKPFFQGRNVLRTTVLVDPEGKVLKVYANIPETEVTTNPKEALQFMTSLMQEQEA